MAGSPYDPRIIRIATYVLAALAGLLVYEVVEGLTPLIRRFIPGERARLIAVGFVTIVVVGVIILIVVAALGFYRRDIGDPQELWDTKLLPLLSKAHEQLPAWLTSRLPDSFSHFREQGKGWV